MFAKNGGNQQNIIWKKTALIQTTCKSTRARVSYVQNPKLMSGTSQSEQQSCILHKRYTCAVWRGFVMIGHVILISFLLLLFLMDFGKSGILQQVNVATLKTLFLQPG